MPWNHAFPAHHSDAEPNRHPHISGESVISERCIRRFSAEQPFLIFSAFTGPHGGRPSERRTLGKEDERRHHSTSRCCVHIFTVSPANRTANERDRIVVKGQETLAMLI